MENLIAYGSGIKATTNDDGSVTVAGYLVRFGSADDTDLTGDFFTKETNFGPIGREGGKVSLFYHHGLDATIKRREIGEATITPDDEGLWLEAQLKARDEYEKKYLPKMLNLISAGKAGLSSGAPSWVVDMEPLTLKSGRKVRHITQWPIGEASITPTPAEIRNVVTTIKSLSEPEEPAREDSEALRALDALVQQTSDFLLEQALDTLITNTNGQTA